ncbi:unnamed protein product, partial [Didymodactylos carnosus]
FRNTWQLEPELFSFRNPEWSEMLSSRLIPKLVIDLGLPIEYLNHNQIYLQLYKLLLYEKNSLFKSYGDTEKTNEMFATLRIIFPSTYEGGKLIVRHNNRERIFDYSKEIDYNFYYIVFYYDCEYELEPIINGNHLVVVYNVILNIEQSSPSIVNCCDETLIQRLYDVLFKWNQQKNDVNNHSLRKIVNPFYHKYSRADLSLISLKRKDRAIVNLLQRTIERLQIFSSSSNQIKYKHKDYLIYLGIITRQETHMYKIQYVNEKESKNNSFSINYMNVVDDKCLQLLKLFELDQHEQILINKSELLSTDVCLNIKKPDNQDHIDYTGIIRL